MLEIRFHGRGGQGTVNGAQLLTKAIVADGGYAQFIPAFGVERKGSPVYGYFRMNDEIIWPKNQVYYPDGVCILDDSLLGKVPVYEGLKKDGFVVLNSKKPAGEQQIPEGVKTFVVLDATGIAREVMGVEIPNTVMLGALLRVLSSVKKETLADLIAEKYGEKNRQAFLAGYERAAVVNVEG
ncbi:MAG: 2-oxoacid:acceptor oxidoreductase family protein [Lachnospiraceae bacterium]|nr:2-oxoacid:acceptor oxidoreductase family protein [Lachnospiraceae bacterium]